LSDSFQVQGNIDTKVFTLMYPTHNFKK